jgi:ubiquinone/menaquinone biosynthesis C-methylase UbiE
VTRAVSFDPVWEDIYRDGRHLNLYPFDIIVSFVFRHYPRQKPRHEVKILEVGCGAGNNLWFAAREGFDVYGIDRSETAIAFARDRFEREGLSGDLRIGDFTQLPFEDDTFDLALDRVSLVCCGRSSAQRAVDEIRRTLHVGGRFLFNPYSDRHSSRAAGQAGPDGVFHKIHGGTLQGVGQICFYGRGEIERLLFQGWRVLSMAHREAVELDDLQPSIHADWIVVAEKEPQVDDVH